MIGLGLASSHCPALFCPPEVWPRTYARMPEYMKDSQPHTAKLETPDVIRSYLDRSGRAFAALREQIEAYRPDAIIFVGDDQGELYDDSNMPALAVFAGDEVWGTAHPPDMQEDLALSRITVPVHGELARLIIDGLLERDFDPAVSSVQNGIGPKAERGISHMVSFPAPSLMPELDIPIVPIFINEYFPPMLSARRCWNLGVALAQILEDRPERVAIYASGGLSHDPAGPRSGWIDEPLDRWVLERIEKNEGEALTSLFTFDSDTMRGGTGEIRAWITAAGACRWAGKVLDYMPIHHAKTGVGFAYWPAEGAPAA